jgi:hypothetical protein
VAREWPATGELRGGAGNGGMSVRTGICVATALGRGVPVALEGWSLVVVGVGM